MTRSALDQALKELHENLIKMGTLVEEAIDKSITALKNKDMALAKQVFEEDDAIDDIEAHIEKLCLNLIARQQPLAKDLRRITAALKMITDLERIADNAADISELTLRFAGQKYIKPLIDIPKMAAMTRKMVDMAITSYIYSDLELAYETCASDDYVDELFSRIKFELIAIVKENNESVDQVIDFLLIAKYLERMADHATNIGEWVIYSITGEHSHVASHYHKEHLTRNPFDRTD
ncbi:MAG: phosphate signaling complex protein PhoU [Clostridia bacterium]